MAAAGAACFFVGLLFGIVITRMLYEDSKPEVPDEDNFPRVVENRKNKSQWDEKRPLQIKTEEK